MSKYISLDIDGVLNYYPQPWIDYLNQRANIQVSNRQEAIDEIGEDAYKKIKSEYRESHTKANLEPNVETVKFIQKLSDAGYKVIISTSRPILDKNYPELFKLTSDWLKKINIPFEKMYYKVDDEEFLNNISHVDFHIDDEMKYADIFSRIGVTTYLYDRENNIENINNPKVFKFSDFYTLEKMILGE